MLKDWLYCHMYCAQLGAPWGTIAGGFRTVSESTSTFMYKIFRTLDRVSDWLGNKGGPTFWQTPPQKSEWGRKQAVAGVGTKSGVSTGKAVYTILCSSLTQVLRPVLS